MQKTQDGNLRMLRKLGVLPTGLVELSSATLSDGLQKLGCKSQVLEPAIRPVVPFTRMAGTAVTVKLAASSKPASYSRLLGQAFEAGLAVSFPVLVAEYPADLRGAAVVGSGGAHVMRDQFGFCGCVVNGAIRDTEDLNRMKFPAFARFAHPEYVFGAMEGVSVNAPVVVGGVEIRPGDIVVGDNDGVVAIPHDRLAEVIQAGEEILRSEQEILREIDEGRPYLEVLRRLQPEAFQD
jgi:4-hydroxy-4-methyl-2-oxoglutarate aldolase